MRISTARISDFFKKRICFTGLLKSCTLLRIIQSKPIYLKEHINAVYTLPLLPCRPSNYTSENVRYIKVLGSILPIPIQLSISGKSIYPHLFPASLGTDTLRTSSSEVFIFNFFSYFSARSLGCFSFLLIIQRYVYINYI